MRIQGVFVVPWRVVALKIAGQIIAIFAVALAYFLDVVGFPSAYLIPTVLGICVGLLALASVGYVVRVIIVERRDRKERKASLAAYRAQFLSQARIRYPRA